MNPADGYESYCRDCTGCPVSWRARRALASWASRHPTFKDDWKFFATLTFRKPIWQDTVAASCLRSFVLAMPRSQRPSFVLWAAQPHVSGSVHLHALWGTSKRPFAPSCGTCSSGSSRWARRCPTWRCLNESWFGRFGIARFRPFDPSLSKGAASYVARYCMKETSMEWGLWAPAEWKEGKRTWRSRQAAATTT